MAQIKMDANAVMAERAARTARVAQMYQDSFKDCPDYHTCREQGDCEGCRKAPFPYLSIFECDGIGDDCWMPSDCIADDGEEMPQGWIIEGLIGEKRKGVIFGKAKAKKSWLALQIAMAVASGRDFLGMKVPRPRFVVYLNMEIPADDMRRRAAAMAKNFPLGGNDEELDIYNFRGQGEAVRKNWLPLLHNTCRADLVIIDPRYKLLLPGEDENTAQGLRGFQAFVDRLAEFSTVMTVVHDGKGTVKGDRGAGSYTTIADYDFALAIDPAGKGEDENLKTLSFPPARSLPSIPPMEIRFDSSLFMFLPTAGTAGK